MSLLQLANVSKHYGQTAVIRELSLNIAQGERHAIIGPNGAGKSTLFDLISGLQRVSGGSIVFRGKPIQGLAPHAIARMGLTRSFQVSSLFQQLTVFENIRCALLWPTGLRYSFWHLLDRDKALTRRVDALLEHIGLSAQRALPAGELAYAQQRALELGMALASGAELMLLDEPVAGMSRSEASKAVALIHSLTQGKTLLIVEHDMSAVFSLADKISVLVHGELIASDSPDKIRANPLVQEAYLGSPITQELSDA